MVSVSSHAFLAMGGVVRLHGIGIIMPLPLGLFPVVSFLFLSMCKWSIKVPLCHLGLAALWDNLSMGHKSEEPLVSCVNYTD